MLFFVLTSLGDGTLLSSGSNIYGQLGRENQEMGFFPVDTNFRPISIAAGLGHSLAICQNRSIVSWGWNQSSQLGRVGPENVPMKVEGENLVSVSGGRVHSLGVTSEGEIWVWGCGRNGRLGVGSSADETEPVLLEISEGVGILQAVSGFDHNLVLIAQCCNCNRL